MISSTTPYEFNCPYDAAQEPFPLLPYCTFSPPRASTSTQTEAGKLSALTEQMLRATAPEQCIAIAHQILDQMELAVPCLVLARASSNPRLAFNFYRRAGEAANKERKTAQFNQLIGISNESKTSAIEQPYVLTNGGYKKCTRECAEYLWRHDRELGVKLLVGGFDFLDDTSLELIWLAVSLLIQTHDLQSAERLLNEVACGRLEWCLLKGLVLFKKHGDNAISRAAIMFSATNDEKTAFLLGTGSTSCEHLRQYAIDTKPAWEQTAGALQWLGQRASSIAHDTSTIPEAQMRMKRWQHNFDLANTFTSKSEYKEAKRLSRMSLRESLWLGLQSVGFKSAFTLHSNLLHLTNSPNDELKTILDNNRCELDSSSKQHTLTFAKQLASLGWGYLTIAQFEPALAILVQAKGLLEQAAESDNEFTAAELANVCFDLGLCLGNLRRYNEAIEQFEQCLQLEEQFLGPTNPRLVPSLDYLWRCLHHADRHEDEHRAKARMTVIDHTSGNDPHLPHGTDCPWFVPTCTTKANR